MHGSWETQQSVHFSSYSIICPTLYRTFFYLLRSTYGTNVNVRTQHYEPLVFLAAPPNQTLGPSRVSIEVWIAHNRQVLLFF